MALTVERLRELLSYDPETGIFRWKIATSIRVRAGARAGSINRNLNYRIIGIDGGNYYEHRLAILYVTGAWPKSLVDHRDGDGQNNCWVNLREATKSNNAANAGKPSKNTTSKLKGVSWHAGAKKWQAHIRVDGKNIYLGIFADEAAAHGAYCAAAIKNFGEFARVS